MITQNERISISREIERERDNCIYLRNCSVASPEDIDSKYSCHKCLEGCDVCDGPESCMSKFMWIKR